MTNGNPPGSGLLAAKLKRLQPRGIAALKSDAKATERGSHVPAEQTGFDRLIVLWQEFYARLTDEDKSLLPTIPIFVSAPQR